MTRSNINWARLDKPGPPASSSQEHTLAEKEVAGRSNKQGVCSKKIPCLPADSIGTNTATWHLHVRYQLGVLDYLRWRPQPLVHALQGQSLSSRQDLQTSAPDRTRLAKTPAQKRRQLACSWTSSFATLCACLLIRARQGGSEPCLIAHESERWKCALPALEGTGLGHGVKPEPFHATRVWIYKLCPVNTSNNTE
jgi:hypothetical protein